jgi:ABC-type polysaccharide/polyol phosphate transport system ATPase subunit
VTIGNAADQVERGVDLASIEAGVDLVQHQHTWTHGEALGELQALAVGQRQSAGARAGELAETGDVQVLRGIDIEVATGDITCILGSNGAGKTTLLRKISGVVTKEACSGPPRG